MGLFDHLFAERAVEDDQAVRASRAEAQQILDWVSSGYHDRFMAWLTTMAEVPISTQDLASTISGATRANTLREVRTHILSRIKWAEGVIKGDF